MLIKATLLVLVVICISQTKAGPTPLKASSAEKPIMPSPGGSSRKSRQITIMHHGRPKTILCGGPCVEDKDCEEQAISNSNSHPISCFCDTDENLCGYAIPESTDDEKKKPDKN